MSARFKNTQRIIEAAIDQITPEMEHMCLLPSTTYVKITRIMHVVRSEIQLRTDDGSRCPPGSQDLRLGEPGEACDEPPKPARARKRAPRRAKAVRRRAGC